MSSRTTSIGTVAERVKQLNINNDQNYDPSAPAATSSQASKLSTSQRLPTKFVPQSKSNVNTSKGATLRQTTGEARDDVLVPRRTNAAPTSAPLGEQERVKPKGDIGLYDGGLEGEEGSANQADQAVVMTAEAAELLALDSSVSGWVLGSADRARPVLTLDLYSSTIERPGSGN